MAFTPMRAPPTTAGPFGSDRVELFNLASSRRSLVRSGEEEAWSATASRKEYHHSRAMANLQGWHTYLEA
jgi:hypothetical protein